MTKKDQDKTREELLTELQELRKTCDSLTKPKDTGNDHFPVKSLRKKAENQLLGKTPYLPNPFSEADMLKLIYELEVHQIELEMQNEELLNIKKEVEESSEHYTELYDFAPSGYITLTRDGKIQKLNLAASRMIDVVRSSLVGRKFGVFVSGNTLPIFNDFFLKLWSGKGKKNCEIELIGKEKTIVNVHMEAIISQKEEICFVTMVDITERVKAIEELRKSEERWKFALEGAADGVWDWDVTTNRVFYSKQWKAMLGYSESEIGDGLDEWSKRVHPDEIDEVLHKVNQHLKGETKFYKNEHRLLTRGGGYLWILDEGKVISRDENGKPLRAIGTQKDITSRKKVESELRKSEEKYRLLVENQNDLVVKIDLQGRFLYVSPSYCELFGKAEQELIRNSFIPLVHEEDRELTRIAMDKLYHPPYACYLEQRALTSNGWRWLAWSDKAVVNEKQEIVNIIGVGRDITDRKSIEIALAESEAKYSIAFQTSPYAISITSAEEGNVVEVNEAFEQISGFSRQELIDNSTINLNLWVDPEERNRVVSELISGTKIFGKECLFRRKNGETLTGLFSAHLINLKNKPHVLASINDISKRKEAEERLMENEALLNAIVETAKDSIFIKDLSLRYIKVNMAMESLFDMPIDEILGKSDSDLFGIENEEHILEIDRQVLAGNTVEEYPAKPVNEVMHYFHTIKVPIRDAHGKIKGLCGIARDITGLKQSENELRNSEERFRQVVEHSREVVWEIDQTGLFTYVSPLSFEVFGYSPEELTGKMHFIDLVPEEGRERVGKIISDLFPRHADMRNIEGRIIKKDGSERTLITNGAPILNKNRELIGYRGTNADITERKQGEEALKKMNEELEKRVKERTEQLTATNYDLDSFAHSVSHDLRAPLRHITGFIKLLKQLEKENRSEEELKYLEIISNGANDMDRMIEALLSFSRLNRAALQKRRINVMEMVKKVMDLFTEQLQNRKIEFKVDALPEIMADETLIRQVWINLISNAIKYTSKKEEARIEIGSISKKDEIVYFVKDNGAGFDNRYAQKLFGVFQRLHKSRDFEGLGIGLSNVQRIITRHGGQCSAEGEVNAGATFYFSLPC